eukprot:360019-Chlamydomonas_euryale.AAC.21
MLLVVASRRYVAWVRRRFQPTLSSPAERILSAYYAALRGAHDRSAARTTVRMLESCVRVAQAHARLCARSSVTAADAVASVLVAEASQGALCVAPPDGAVYSEFADDPDEEHAAATRRVMLALGLPLDIADQPAPRLPARVAAQLPADAPPAAHRASAHDPLSQRPETDSPQSRLHLQEQQQQQALVQQPHTQELTLPSVARVPHEHVQAMTDDFPGSARRLTASSPAANADAVTECRLPHMLPLKRPKLPNESIQGDAGTAKVTASHSIRMMGSERTVADKPPGLAPRSRLHALVLAGTEDFELASP